MNRNLRTSITDPIQIPTLPAASGRIGISFCPGKQGPVLAGFDWKRDLAVDLDAVRGWGAAAVVSLIEKHEMELLGVGDLDTAVAARGMEWFHLPIPDVTAPGEEFEQRWHTAGARLRSLLIDGENVFIHCRGGLGRAGTVAARLLIELGITDSDTAIAQVREVRPGAIETRAQEDHLRAIERSSAFTIGPVDASLVWRLVMLWARPSSSSRGTPIPTSQIWSGEGRSAWTQGLGLMIRLWPLRLVRLS